MNRVIFTGYLPTDSVMRVAPGGARKLTFDVVLRDSAGVEVPERCFLDREELIKKHEPLLTAGRGVIIEGERTGHQYEDRRTGAKGNWIREVRVTHAEFPNRGGKKEEPEPDAAVATPSQP
ncbi:MAG TPA: hypothetical protein VG838_00600 [Opitutaceae bacterium]|nr:hypothetical protein [Opitutaceae bacterium]